jgi:hypothetical protein
MSSPRPAGHVLPGRIGTCCAVVLPEVLAVAAELVLLLQLWPRGGDQVLAVVLPGGGAAPRSSPWRPSSSAELVLLLQLGPRAVVTRCSRWCWPRRSSPWRPSSCCCASSCPVTTDQIGCHFHRNHRGPEIHLETILEKRGLSIAGSARKRGGGTTAA